MNEHVNILKSMDFVFFTSGKHKISSEKLFESNDTVFLDVRSNEEVQTVTFPLKFQTEYIHIPTNEIPDKLSDIPRNRTVGIFCSAGIRAAIVYAFFQSK
jgi:rhodanese-related sulfurtransferase